MSLNIKVFKVNPLEVNTYVVHDETKEAVIIDPGCFTESEWKEILTYINTENLQVKHMLLTHLHFDHVKGSEFVERDLKLKIEAHDDDLGLYNRMEKLMTDFIGIDVGPQHKTPLGVAFRDGDSVTFGNHRLQVIHTPGHSRGSICFFDDSEHILFSGDTLFQGTAGRTDFEEGNFDDILSSIRNKLKPLPDDTTVYPGHGDSTNIGLEKKYNPFLKW